VIYSVNIILSKLYAVYHIIGNGLKYFNKMNPSIKIKTDLIDMVNG